MLIADKSVNNEMTVEALEKRLTEELKMSFTNNFKNNVIDPIFAPSCRLDINSLHEFKEMLPIWKSQLHAAYANAESPSEREQIGNYIVNLIKPLTSD